ncbi:MAG: DUF1015 domain-containing protein [Lachnospiraceae bacterium]|nr:DUF1015 domain-containing protein [Lachnospiraceae bacterium]
MAIVKPFVCVHPAENHFEEVAALPYDVYSRAEAKAAAAKRPYSFLNIDRPETQFPDEQDMYADCVYEKAASMLQKWQEDGILKQEEEACYFIYSLTMDGREQTGIVGCSSVDDYLNGVIRKHEFTLAEKEQDRIRHVDVCSTQTGPIFLAYRHSEEIRSLIHQVKLTAPLFDFVSEDGVRHAGWKVAEPAVNEALEKAFQEISRTYIADGHHRCASAAKVALKRREENPGYTGKEEFNYFLSILFPDDELKILPYNRVVKDLNGLTTQEFLEKTAEKFNVEKAAEAVNPSEKGTYGMYLDDQWYLLRQRPEFVQADSVEGLDVAYLQRELLTPVLGIKDPKKDCRIAFSGGIRGTGDLEKRCHTDMKVAFSLYPTSIQELFAVADAERMMPPKSTWFEPKLRSGLFLHRF